MTTRSRVGVVADDLTGATDLAIAAASRGRRAVVCLGVPADVTRGDLRAADVVVVALPIRSALVQEAVTRSVAAVRALRRIGAERFMFKYCSTFDSTPQGNIGPVLEAMLAETGAPWTVVVPSFPATGRTVEGAILRVHGTPLAETAMRDHPLNPMRESDVRLLLAPQLDDPTGHAVGWVGLDEVRRDARAALEQQAEAGARAIVMDAVEEADLERVHEATADLTLTTGAAGLVTAWPVTGPPSGVAVSADGPSVSLVGSQSEASREQLRAAEAAGQPVLPIEYSTAPAEQAATATAQRCLELAGPTPVVVHAARPRGDADPAQAQWFEQFFGHLAAALADHGVRRLVIGGGETSGSVAAALGVEVLEIGPPIAAGVCWSRAEVHSAGDEPRTFALALKSGNFGGPDFLTRAWEVLDD
ncbi:four-carbon acid sugar kinase family protein [Ruania suaedae]|uniref:four-carbon acid sugar kinase family protein n=1 Tax=Ruania suaedae TaxID=2897774 RepID=UPI001E3C8012|nr:four-carbon acid sugar kinase family protein [Ruania suaedae]UFU02881.1 four-carbon acid sugar kinase family protein [Ruania suaedae]